MLVFKISFGETEIMPYVGPEIRPTGLAQTDLHAFAREIKPDAELVAVKLANKPRPFGNCYWNVAAVMKESGGSMQVGWVLRIWRDYYIEAQHHSVWRMPSGRLLDVTEFLPDPPRGYTPSHTSFLPDDRIEIDLERVPAIPSRHKALAPFPEFEDMRRAYLAVNSAEKEMSDLIWELGYRCESQFATGTSMERVFIDFRLNASDTERLTAIERKKGLANFLFSQAEAAFLSHKVERRP